MLGEMFRQLDPGRQRGNARDRAIDELHDRFFRRRCVLIVVAQIGLALTGNQTLYGVVVAMAVVTTMAAPPLVRAVFKGEQTPPGNDAANRLQRT